MIWVYKKKILRIIEVFLENKWFIFEERIVYIEERERIENNFYSLKRMEIMVSFILKVKRKRGKKKKLWIAFC